MCVWVQVYEVVDMTISKKKRKEKKKRKKHPAQVRSFEVQGCIFLAESVEEAIQLFVVPSCTPTKPDKIRLLGRNKHELFEYSFHGSSSGSDGSLS